MTEYELFGADIALGNNFQASIAANGELVLADGCACAVQQVTLRLFTMLGALFYDVEYGSKVLLFIREESTQATREALCVEVETCTNGDPHVEPGTARCRVQQWNHEGVDLDLTFTLIEQSHPEHLVVRVGENNGEITLAVIKNAKPDTNTSP